MASRTPLMAGNWKMNVTHPEAVALVQKLAWILADKKHDYTKTEVVVVPPFTDLRSVQTVVDGDHLSVRYAAQDVSAHDSGAYTGEISATMLAKLGCSYVVVGHSERREYHAESDETVNAKARQALGAGMTPIVCVGEGLDVRKAGEQVPYTLAQVDGSLAGFTPQQIAVARGRLRAGVGDRDRRGRDARRRAGGLRGDPRAAPRDRRRRGCRRLPDPVRRLGEGRQHRRDHGAAGRRRGAGGRREPAGRGVRRDLPLLRHAHAVTATATRRSANRSGPVGGPPRNTRNRDVGYGAVTTVFTILLVITSCTLVLLVLLHKGRGGGLSDMFGGGVSSSLGGSSVAERNLDRFTVGVGVIWFACVIALGLLLAYQN